MVDENGPGSDESNCGSGCIGNNDVVGGGDGRISFIRWMYGGKVTCVLIKYQGKI